MLDRKGCPIAYMARNSDEAVEKHRPTPTEFVIMDYSMPFKDRVEAAKEILREYPGTKFFLITCGEVVSGLLNGLDMVTMVKKPFTFKLMIDLLERAVHL